MSSLSPNDYLAYLLTSQPPPILYHYTSLSGVLGIVNSERIWATKINYLNDESEAKVIWGHVLDFLQRRIRSAIGETARILARLINLVEERRPCTDFVASFSEDGDSLSQWRGYCPEGNGVSIGFDSRALRSQWIADPGGGKSVFVGAGLNQVQYLPAHQDGSLDLQLDQLLAFCQTKGTFEGFHGPISEEEHFAGWISAVAGRYKHEAFRPEREWRLAMLKPHRPMPCQRFRLGESMLLPYVEVELNRNLQYEQGSDYFIREVVVGPTPHALLSNDSIRSLFISRGHPEVKVLSSAIPFRHW